MVYPCAYDLRLTILGYEDCRDMTHGIWVSSHPENLPIREICGFHGSRVFCVNAGLIISAVRITFIELFAKMSKYYVRDCLWNHKMVFFSKLGGEEINLLSFFCKEFEFLLIRLKKSEENYTRIRKNNIFYLGHIGDPGELDFWDRKIFWSRFFVLKWWKLTFSCEKW